MRHVKVYSSKGFANIVYVNFPDVTEPLSLVRITGHVTVSS